jgi:hypothetical protein
MIQNNYERALITDGTDDLDHIYILIYVNQQLIKS